MITYTIYSPDDLNFPLGVIDKKGNVLSGIRGLEIIITNAKKGLANNKANNLLCVLDIDNPEEKDLITLGKLLGRPSKPKDRNFVSNLLKRFQVKKDEFSDRVDSGKHAPLILRSSIAKIKSGNRYTSKVDWTSDRVKNQVQGLLAIGESLSYIARHLGVSRSTLTKANQRHNYRLYIPEKKDREYDA
jgi:hypothetical protein